MPQTGTAPVSDRTLTCSDCGTSFVFTASEQEFFASKNFTPPKRCKRCRKIKKQERGRDR